MSSDDIEFLEGSPCWRCGLAGKVSETNEMSWPLSQDFNEAVQNASTAFSDPVLKGGKVVTNPMGMPIPRSGNYADVYQVMGADGQAWAVKCFTRAVATGIEGRFAAIADHLNQANLPFTVGFDFQPEGIRVRGVKYPIVKMQWVDGYPINQFVHDNLNRASILEAMLSLWVRLCRRLRETGMAHCDIQHGNVLLVPATGKNSTLGLKLVDYDGLYVPALEGKPSGEAGHASYQHPERVYTGAYSADLDRFPHLVVATALRGLLIGGPAMWKKYDNGDNLMFSEKDFKQPAQSRLMRELWETGDPFTVGLVGHLALACTKPLAQTPWLDQLMPGGQPPILTPNQERQAAAILGIAMAGPAPVPAVVPNATVPVMATPRLNFNDDSEGDGSLPTGEDPPRRRAKANNTAFFGTIAIGVIAFGSIAGGAAFLFSKKAPDVVQAVPTEPMQSVIAIKPPEPKPPEVKVVPTPTKPDVPKPPDPMANTDITTTQLGGRVVWSAPSDDDATIQPVVVRYSSDGAKLFVAPANKGIIHILNASNGQRLSTYKDEEDAKFIRAAAIPNGRMLVTTKESHFYVWNPVDNKKARVLYAKPFVWSSGMWTDRLGTVALMMSNNLGRVVDLAKGTDITTFELPDTKTHRVSAVLAADGSAVLAIAPNGTMRITDLRRGTVLVEKPLADANLLTVMAWLPERKLVVLRETDKSRSTNDAVIVDAATGEIKQKIAGRFFHQAAFTPGGQFLILLGPGSISAWAVDGFKKVADIPAPNLQIAYDFDISPDGTKIAYAGADRFIHMVAFDADVIKPTVPTTSPTLPNATVASLTDLATIPPGTITGVIRYTSLDPSGTSIAIGTQNELRVLAVLTRIEQFRYAPPDGSLGRVWSTTDTVIVEVRRADKSTELHVLDRKTGKLAPTRGIIDISRPDGAFAHIAVSANGEYVSTITTVGGLTITDLRTGRRISQFPNFPGARFVDFNSQLDRVYIADDNVIYRYEFPSMKPSTAIAPMGIVVPYDVEDVSPDGRFVLCRKVGTDDTFITVYHTADGKMSCTITCGLRGVRARFTATSQHFVIVDGTRVEIYDVLTGKSVGRKIQTNANTSDIAVSVGSPVLAVASRNEIKIYRTGTDTGMTADGFKPLPAVRLPIPDATAIAEAETKVKELYKADYAKKLPADRRKLAEKLAKLASETVGDTPAKYFLLKEVIAIGTELNDPTLSTKAIDSIDETFEIDGFAQKLAILDKLSSTASQTTTLRTVAELASDMVEESVERDEYEKALKLTAVAITSLNRAGLNLLAREIETRQTQIRKMRDAFETVRTATEKLKASPDDVAAKATVGKYRCFMQGRWEEGLTLLASSNDEPLRKIAELELKASTDLETTDSKRGEAWWNYAQSLAETERAPATSRAKYWYAKALQSQTGLDRVAAENRLKFTQGGIEYRPGIVVEASSGPTIARLTKRRGRVEYAVDFDANEFRSIAQYAGMKWTGYIVPPTSGRYKIIADTKEAVRVKFGTKPDEKVIIEAKSIGLGKREAIVLLNDRPIQIAIEYESQTTQNHAIKLKWIRPGSKTEEAIPSAALFHIKADEKLLTEK